jgi:hypothetical protein
MVVGFYVYKHNIAQPIEQLRIQLHQRSPQTDKDVLRTDERSFINAAELDESYAVPNEFYYVWCGDSYFELRHYLAMSSVIYYMQPDNIVMYYGRSPRHDNSGYYTWLAELVQNFPFYISKNESTACAADGTPNVTFITDELLIKGGIYVDNELVLARPLHEYRKELGCMEVVDAIDNKLLLLIAESGSTSKCRSTTVQQLHGINLSVNGANLSDTIYNNTDLGPQFLVLNQTIYPKDIWELDNSIGRILRTVMYGKPHIARPIPSYDELIPNIAHTVWFGTGEMNFLFYLCVLSLLHIAKVDKVYIHGDAPHGFYWDLVRSDPRLKLIPRKVDHVFGDTRPTAHKQHLADICRVDALVKYGGIYVDLDALFVRPLSHEIRGYDAVISLDVSTTVKGTMFPESFNNGVMIGKRNVRFFRLLLNSMKEYRPRQFFWICLQLPYKVKERFPTSVLIDPHLEVICSGPSNKCRPTFLSHMQWSDFNDLSFEEVIGDWKKAAFVYQFPTPKPYQFSSHEELLKSQGRIADIGRFVLEEAGMLKYFQDLVQVNRTLL